MQFTEIPVVGTLKPSYSHNISEPGFMKPKQTIGLYIPLELRENIFSIPERDPVTPAYAAI